MDGVGVVWERAGGMRKANGASRGRGRNNKGKDNRHHLFSTHHPPPRSRVLLCSQLAVLLAPSHFTALICVDVNLPTSSLWRSLFRICTAYTLPPCYTEMVSFIHVSGRINFTLSLFTLSRLPPVFLQADLIPVCQELGIAVLAYSPLGRGLLTGTIRSADQLHDTDWRKKVQPRFTHLDQVGAQRQGDCNCG